MCNPSEKSQIRTNIKKRLNDFLNNPIELHSLNDYTLISSSFADVLCSSELYKNADIVLAYASMSEEAPTAGIIAQCLLDGKKLALPRIKNTSMDFFFVDAATPLENQLHKSTYGIDEPLDCAKCFCPESLLTEQSQALQNILVIVPAIAFTKQGHRLGRGGGFYDRYLARLLSPSAQTAHPAPFSIHLCGMCYNFQILDALPCEKHDVPMQYILSEKELVVCEN